MKVPVLEPVLGPIWESQWEQGQEPALAQVMAGWEPVAAADAVESHKFGVLQVVQVQ